MQPIFKEMIQMWSDLGYPLPIQEGRFWLHNHFICGFKSDGELHKLWKYKVFDEYTIDDVIKVFALNFWDMKVLVDSDFETLTEIAYKYDELYGEGIGDKPTFG